MPEFAPPTGWTPRTLPSLRKALIAWFDAHRRDLPWRADRDPYRIWVSEVMLQQTTVAAVVPYFERFVAAFPTLTDLAAADEQRVLALWAGLGYYRRARHLHRAARQLAAGHGGALPDDVAVWAGLPGVGRYILGAVLSQAFDRRLPIVEANSLRVLARLFASTIGSRRSNACDSTAPRMYRPTPGRSAHNSGSSGNCPPWSFTSRLAAACRWRARR